MDIDTMDFTPWYYRRGSDIGPLLSKDEYRFLDKLRPGELNTWMPPADARSYLQKLFIYYERFQNHMPIAIRKELLRELERK